MSSRLLAALWRVSPRLADTLADLTLNDERPPEAGGRSLGTLRSEHQGDHHVSACR